MHEYSIVQSLVDSVEKAVCVPALAGRPAEAGPRTVHGILVRIGDLSGVDTTLLATAFEVFRAGTICEDATMTIERVPARWSCPDCGAEIPAGAALRCAKCQKPARLTSGDEIILQRIELEVPDVSGLRMR
ncbi:MAG TPA: hydrogenase maturation nickel metallochaperone HypA [Thermoanaerobaculia bacterium]|nr:hydrogenase maturation nickel metallochaperone HypA [Thermoanaerobaculia bacterium]